LLYGRRDAAPQNHSSNLWAVTVDAESARVTGEPVQVTEGAGFNVRDVRATSDWTRLTVLRERNQSDVYVAALGDGGRSLEEPSRLTLDDLDDTPSAWSRDGRSVVFWSNRGGFNDVFRQDLDQRVPERLAATGRSEVLGEPSPDGAWLLYSIVTASDGSPSNVGFERDVLRVPSSGGPAAVVMTGVGARFHCARTRCVVSEPEGSVLVFRALDPMEGRGAELRRIDLGVTDLSFATWALTDDGSRVALASFDDHLRVFDLTGGDVATLNVEGWAPVEFVDWAADGQALFAVGTAVNDPQTNNAALLRVSLEGGVTVLRHVVNQWHIRPVASPDGSRLAFGMMVLDSNAWMIEGF